MTLARDDGYTLLEVLVALVITALISSALAGLTKHLWQIESRVEAQRDTIETVLAFRRLFQTSVASATPPAAFGAASTSTSSTINLFTRGPASFMLDRPIPFSLSVVGKTGRTALVADWHDPETGRAISETVVDGAGAIDFSYLGIDAAGKARWQSEWSDPSAFPRAILARIQIDALGPPIDIVARPPAGLPHACIALPHLSVCQQSTGY